MTVDVERPPMIIQDDGITILINGNPFIIDKSHINYTLLMDAIRENDWEKVVELAEQSGAIKNYVSDYTDISVEDGKVLHYDPNTDEWRECSGYVVDKIFEFMKNGINPGPLVNFLHRVMKNPSFMVIRDLYKFLSHKGLPIDPDGCFYGYKAIRNNWTDKWSGKIANYIGNEVSIPRRAVNDDPRLNCSYGLHVGSIEYVRSFASRYGEDDGDRIIIVKVDPADVVAVPQMNTTKLRCCKYRVISEFTGQLPDTIWKKEDNKQNNVGYSFNLEYNEVNDDDDYED